jgi:hypothetical protein
VPEPLGVEVGSWVGAISGPLAVASLGAELDIDGNVEFVLWLGVASEVAFSLPLAQAPKSSALPSNSVPPINARPI